MPIQFKQIDPSGYTGLANAKIRTYNNNVKDLAREYRKGRGDDAYSRDLVENSIPNSQKGAVKEMVSQDTRNGRRTDYTNMGGETASSSSGGGGGGGSGGGRSASS